MHRATEIYNNWPESMIKSFVINSKWESYNIPLILMKKFVISVIIYNKKT